MSDFSVSSPAEHREESTRFPADPEYRRRLRLHESSVRFYFVLNIATALAATAVLKSDGPYYADSIAAGLYLCGGGLSLYALRSTQASDIQLRAQETDRPDRSGRPRAAPVFLLFLTFFVAAACLAAWFTYIAPPASVTSDEDGLTAVTTTRPEAC